MRTLRAFLLMLAAASATIGGPLSAHARGPLTVGQLVRQCQAEDPACYAFVMAAQREARARRLECVAQPIKDDFIVSIFFQTWGSNPADWNVDAKYAVINALWIYAPCKGGAR